MTNSRLLRSTKATLAVAAVLALAVVGLAQAASAAGPGIVTRGAAGSSSFFLIGTVDTFRADLGGLNNGTGGTFPDGRREISWEAVPDSLSTPNFFPGDFFRNRGAVFSTSGLGFLVSADSFNPTNSPPRFGDVDPSYFNTFDTFSPERLFAPRNSTVTEVDFVVPGTSKPATVDGFGAVFTDVDGSAVARIEYFDKERRRILEQFVPEDSAATNGSGTLSFAGATFDTARVAKVRITAGTATITAGNVDNSGVDVVVMDDFIYGEPQEIKAPPPPPPNTRPIVTPLSPAPNAQTGDTTPTISARVTDAQTDLTSANIRLLVDGTPRPFAYDRGTDRLSHTSGALNPGLHRVNVIATDAKGLLTLGNWSFRVTG